MRIKKIHIQNYKSLVDFELDNPPPFCAFVGPNASGKSNIFEALEFTNYVIRFGNEAPAFFGEKESIYSYKPIKIERYEERGNTQSCCIEFADQIIIDFFVSYSTSDKSGFSVIASPQHKVAEVDIPPTYDIRNLMERDRFILEIQRKGIKYDFDYEQFVDRFSRIFVGKSIINRAIPSQLKLISNAANLSEVIGQIFQNKNKREDFIEWLQILIPEFKNIEVKKSNIDGSYEFFVYEEISDKPFPKHLISDGTYNILALMAAVYQSTEPQFLCIEEPENGLHPQAIKLLVDFFREKCEEEGHHIWLNSHSQTLVRCLEKDEMILVNKVKGRTRAKRVTNMNHIDINTDEAWLTNALGGGTIWSK